MKKNLKVTCAVIFFGGKVFAARRGMTMNQPLRWEFPGGKIEQGETEPQCLVRELSEELEINVEVLEKLPAFTHHYTEFSIELIPFVCRVNDPQHLACEHDQTGWFTAAQLKELDWAPADVQVMEYVVREVFSRYS
jgi:8-oxo-dGTP diphosphatase